ncbi:riboflavin kinase [Candidatus Uhrbacteria bacterium]|nr:riboflavin kinase [Candidatus Uhrbacteria bacterium]
MVRPLSFHGRVEKGEGIAAQLGCPTANVAVEQGAIIPALGVYVGEAEVDGQRYQALICINDGRTGYNLKMEVHLVGQKDIDFTGKHISVDLYEKIRDLIPFPGNEVMTEMIKVDLENARKWFATSSPI